MYVFTKEYLYSQVVKAIVSRDRKEFIARAIVEFGLMMVRWFYQNREREICWLTDYTYTVANEYRQ